MKYLLKVILFSLFFIFFGNMYSCSCEEPGSIKAEFVKTDIIVAGTILSKELVAISPDSSSTYSEMHYTFLTSKVYKGKFTNDTLSIYSGIGDSDCGFLFEVGLRYVIYGIIKNQEKKSINTSICTRTKLFDIIEISELEALKSHLDLYFENPINPEILPKYKHGGEEDDLIKFIYLNLKLPKNGAKSGKVYVKFDVDENGFVRNVEVLKGISTEFDNEAMRVVKMLEFFPGTYMGIPIVMDLIIPINFSRIE